MNQASSILDKKLVKNQNNTTTQSATLQTPNDKPDSHTRVYQRLHGCRTTMSVRILPELKEAFTRHTRELGLSTCHVAEGLIKGWLYGLNEKVELVHQSPTINLTLVRDVKRVRRYAREEVGDAGKSEGSAELLKCGVCGGMAYAKAIDKDGSRLLCRVDFGKVKPRLLGWKVLK